MTESMCRCIICYYHSEKGHYVLNSDNLTKAIPSLLHFINRVGKRMYIMLIITKFTFRTFHLTFLYLLVGQFLR